MENMGSTNVTSRGPFFHLLLLNGKISAQSNNVSYKIFQHDIVIKVQKQNCSLCPVSLPTFFLSFSAFIWASISSGLVYVLIRPLWPPFLPVTMAKKKKKITSHKFVYTFQRKHLIYKVVWMLFEAFQKYIRLYYPYFNFTSTKIRTRTKDFAKYRWSRWYSNVSFAKTHLCVTSDRLVTHDREKNKIYLIT